MKKEIIALSLLIALVLGSWLNILHVDSLTARVIGRAANSMAMAERGEFEAASRELDAAADIWLGSKSYTHTFLRHSEVDVTAEALYELRGCYDSEDLEGSKALYDALIYHLELIARMEHPYFGSVF